MIAFVIILAFALLVPVVALIYHFNGKIGINKGTRISKEPKVVDYSNVIEVGDTIGFRYTRHYLEGVVKAILKDNSILNRETEYVINITLDDNDDILFHSFSWVGYTKILDIKYRQWTMIKKNPEHFKSVTPK